MIHILTGGPSVAMGTEVTTQEILIQAEESGVSRIVIFPFPSTALADGEINFGSDIPFGTMKGELEKVLSLPVGDDKKEWILSKNLKRLIRLK